MIVADLVDAFLVAVESAHPAVAPGHVLSGALPLQEVRDAELVLEVQRVFSGLLWRVEAAVGLSDVGVAAGAIIIVTSKPTMMRRIDVLPLSTLVVANIHRNAPGVLATGRVVRASKPTIIPRNVHVATRAIDLVVALVSIVALVDAGGEAETGGLGVSQAHGGGW